MDYPEFGISGLEYNDEYFEFHGAMRLGRIGVGLHFPLNGSEPPTESELIARHADTLLGIKSRLDSLIKQAKSKAIEGDVLPDLSTIIIYDDTFSLQFGSSNPEDMATWCEADYEKDGTLYDFAKHSSERE